MSDKPLHEGHRQRMLKKLLSGDTLYDHEMLEIMLYYIIPRHNTNPLAHKLLSSFGSITGILEAAPEALMRIDGVGEKVTEYIKCLNEVMVRVDREALGIVTLRNYEDFKRFTALRLSSKTEEVLELYLLEKNGKVRTVHTFTNNEVSRVGVETGEVFKIIISSKPYALVIAHNHLSGNSNPSVTDDRFTAEMQVMCSMNNVHLLDHCIYASEANIYSYYLSGKIDTVKEQFNFKKLVDSQYKNTIRNGQFKN